MLDFTDLQNEVIDMWENSGVVYQTLETVTTDPYPITDLYFTPYHAGILEDPMACINELGYNSIADYLADNHEPLPKTKTVFYMSGVLSKRFREATWRS